MAGSLQGSLMHEIIIKLRISMPHLYCVLMNSGMKEVGAWCEWINVPASY